MYVCMHLFIYLVDKLQLCTISLVARATVHLVLQRPVFPPFLSTRSLEAVGEKVDKFAKGNSYKENNQDSNPEYH